MASVWNRWMSAWLLHCGAARLPSTLDTRSFACKTMPTCRLQSLTWESGFPCYSLNRRVSDVVVVNFGGQHPGSRLRIDPAKCGERVISMGFTVIDRDGPWACRPARASVLPRFRSPRDRGCQSARSPVFPLLAHYASKSPVTDLIRESTPRFHTVSRQAQPE